MPLEDILKKIRDESEKAVKEILEDAEARSQNRLEGARAEAEARASSVLADVKAQAEKVRSAARTRADAKRRQILLREKQALIDGVFKKASEVLASLPADEYKALVLDSLARSAEGNETVVLGPEDRERLVPGFVDELNRQLTSRGKAGAVKVEYSDRSLGGGYLLQSGGVSLNTTFPALMKRYQDELEIEVARLLFS